MQSVMGPRRLENVLENGGGKIEIAHIRGHHYVAVGAKGFEPLGNGVVSAPEEEKAAAILESVVKWNDTKSEVSQARAGEGRMFSGGISNEHQHNRILS